jgi:hypothetical protein
LGGRGDQGGGQLECASAGIALRRADEVVAVTTLLTLDADVDRARVDVDVASTEPE